MTRAEIEALSDEDLKALNAVVCSVVFTRFRYTKKNSRAAQLADMSVGDILYFSNDTAHVIHRSAYFARKRLGDPNAKWKSRNTTKGLKVTRII